MSILTSDGLPTGPDACCATGLTVVKGISEALLHTDETGACSTWGGPGRLQSENAMRMGVGRRMRTVSDGRADAPDWE